MKSRSAIAEGMPRSGIREVMEAAANLDREVIHLEVGEPSFDTPGHIIDAAFADASRGYTRYTPNAGLASLRAAIAADRTARWGRVVDDAEVIVTAGGVNALCVALFALTEAGDEVLLPDPGWPNYTSLAVLCRATPRYFELRPDDRYVLDPDRLARELTDRTKAIVINNPSNPTGAVSPADVVAALVEIVREHDVYLVADEIYEDFVYDEPFSSTGSAIDPRIVVVSGVSKRYAMTGWRLGYAVAEPSLVALVAKLMEPLVSNASSISQRAAEAALRGSQECVVEMREAYRGRRDLVHQLLEPAGLLAAPPGGAFYALVDLRALGLSGRDAALRLLEEEGVATAPGETFGAQAAGMVRISFATDEGDLREACRRMIAFAERHRPGTASPISVAQG